MNAKLWSICNDLETVAINHDTARETLGYILEGLDGAACEARKGGGEASAAFLNRYTYFAGMVYLILDMMLNQGEEAKALINRAFEIAKEGTDDNNG